MAYKLDYTYIDLELSLNEDIIIEVYEYEFKVLCNNKLIQEQLINFLEYLDVELIKFDEVSLTNILDREFKVM